MGREPQVGFPFKKDYGVWKTVSNPVCCGSVWRDAGEVGSRAIGRVSLLIILFVALEIGRCILLKKIRHFECSAVYVGIYI